MAVTQPAAVLADGLRNMVTSAAKNTSNIVAAATAKKAASPKVTKTPAEGTPGATAVAAAPQVNPDHPLVAQWGLQPEEAAKYQKTHDDLSALLDSRQVTPEQIQSAYQPAIDEVNNTPVPQTPSPGRAFMAALGSPQNAPSMLQHATDNALSVQQEKKSHLFSLKEAITHAVIQQQLQEGQTKQALDTTMKLEELHRAQELEDMKTKHTNAMQLAGVRNRSNERQMADRIAAQYGIADSHDFSKFVGDALDSAERNASASGIAYTDADRQATMINAAQTYQSMKHGKTVKAVTTPAVTPKAVPGALTPGDYANWQSSLKKKT